MSATYSMVWRAQPNGGVLATCDGINDWSFFAAQFDAVTSRWAEASLQQFIEAQGIAVAHFVYEQKSA